MMNVAEWILVVMLAVTLFIFLVAGIILIVKLVGLANEAKKIVIAGQGIAAKADDIVDNVKGMTSVGGIVKTFANHVIQNQERRYAEEDAMREAEAEAREAEAKVAAAVAKTAAKEAEAKAKKTTKTAKK